MRVLASPEFSAKMQAFDSEVSVLSSIRALLDSVDKNDRERLLSNGTLVSLDAGLYVLRGTNVSLFAAFGEDGQGPYLLLLDMFVKEVRGFGHRIIAINDPRRNNALNPHINRSINPRTNNALNPRINASINPRINGILNPRINASINPRINATVNYRINSSINPRINASLNPRINDVLNPRINRSFGGPFVYDLGLDLEGFVVRGNNTVLLFFDNDADFLGVGVENSARGYALFDLENEWTGLLVPDGQDHYLRFDVENEWTGLVI